MPGDDTRQADPSPAVALATAAERMTGGPARRSRMIGFVIGMLLLTGAIVAVRSQQGALGQAWDSLSSAGPMLIGMGIFLPIVGVALTSATFWLLTTRYGRVTYFEMTALLSSAWLLNYLPLWPGMIGRLTYHKKVNEIAVADSAKVLIWANVLNVVAAGVTLLAAGVALILTSPSSPYVAPLAALPIPVVLIFAGYAHARPSAHGRSMWRTMAALGTRLTEHQVWAARFFVCFAATGTTIPWGAALLIAGGMALAIAVPLTGNSLGVREWAVGLIASVLPITVTASTTVGLDTGLAADLTNRAFELIVALPAGLLGAAWLAKRMKRLGASRD